MIRRPPRSTQSRSSAASECIRDKYMYNLERLELCIQNLADNRAHDEGVLYIPLLGRYKEDKVSPRDFVDLVVENLSDGKFDVILVQDY